VVDLQVYIFFANKNRFYGRSLLIINHYKK